MFDPVSIRNANNPAQLAAGLVDGGKLIRICGRATGVVSGQWQDVWGGSGLDSSVVVSTWSTDNDIDSVVSTSASDAGKTVAIEGVTIAGVEVPAQTVTLNGQTRVAIPIPLARINRVYGTGQTALAGIVSAFAGAANHTAGVVTAAALRAVIRLDNGLSGERNWDGRYSIPAGRGLLVYSLRATNVRSSGTAVINSARLCRRRGTALDVLALVGLNSSTVPEMGCELSPPAYVAGPADLVIVCDASASGAVTAWGQGVEITL